MKILKTIIALFAIALAISCSKDDDRETAPEFKTENPLESYHAAAGFTKVANFINSGDYEFGLAFSPAVKGNMKAITLKLPAVNSSVRVTIWDYDSRTVLRSETLNVASADLLVKKEITILPLEKDKKYVITMNSKDWYKKSKPNDEAASYPIVAGNITFHQYLWLSGTAQAFPTNISQNYNGGDLSFDFQQTE